MDRSVSSILCNAFTLCFASEASSLFRRLAACLMRSSQSLDSSSMRRWMSSVAKCLAETRPAPALITRSITGWWPCNSMSNFYTRQWPALHLPLQQIGGRPGGHCNTRLSQIITDKYHKKEAFPLVKCIWQHMYNGTVIILVLVWCKSIQFWWSYVQKNDF